MRETIVRVVKIGGSLFDLPDLPERLWKWMAVQSPAHHVLVAGGGKLVNVVREWDRQKTLDDAAAHWMCVDLLTVTAHFPWRNSTLLPQADPADTDPNDAEPPAHRCRGFFHSRPAGQTTVVVTSILPLVACE